MINKTDKTKAVINVFDNGAQLYQDKFMNLDLYRNSLDLFCENQKQKDAQILDIACGPGNITRFILSKNPDYKILGIDLSSKMIELAKTN
ncbi:MAG: methyltransferase domain-containing protein, partial [Bacteroidetes bacterium]|nr:methyltransferase domain-containing protein [Bacteroidota bacterium]